MLFPNFSSFDKLKVSDRHLRMTSKSIIRDTYDFFVEAGTNSYSSIVRMKQKNKKKNFYVTYTLTLDDDRQLKELIIEDNAEGMAGDTLSKILDVGVSNGQGDGIRSVYGTGIKMCMVSVGSGKFETVQDEILSIGYIGLDDSGSIKAGTVNAKVASKHGYSPSFSGTKITLTATDSKKYKVPDLYKLKKQISQHFDLVKLNSDPDVTVILIYKEPGRKPVKEVITFCPPAVKRSFPTIVGRLENYNDNVKINIHETYAPLDFASQARPENLGGFYVSSGGIYFDRKAFVTEEAAKYFYGEVLCEKMSSLILSEDITPLDHQRTGLMEKDAYVSDLRKLFEEKVEPILKEKRAELKGDSRADEAVFDSDSIKKINLEINKGLNEVMEELGLDTSNDTDKKQEGGVEDIVGTETKESKKAKPDFDIFPKSATIALNEKKKFTVSIKKELHSVISLEGVSSNLDVSTFSKLEEIDGFKYTTFEVTGKVLSSNDFYVVNGNSKIKVSAVVVPEIKHRVLEDFIVSPLSSNIVLDSDRVFTVSLKKELDGNPAPKENLTIVTQDKQIEIKPHSIWKLNSNGYYVTTFKVTGVERGIDLKIEVTLGNITKTVVVEVVLPIFTSNPEEEYSLFNEWVWSKKEDTKQRAIISERQLVIFKKCKGLEFFATSKLANSQAGLLLLTEVISETITRELTDRYLKKELYNDQNCCFDGLVPSIVYDEYDSIRLKVIDISKKAIEKQFKKIQKN